MDSAERELFERSLRHATRNQTGGALDAALQGLAWHDALSADPQAAVSILFELQGSANATSSAIEDVVAVALGVHREPTTGIVMPALGEWDPPGKVDGERLVVRGLGTAALTGRERALVVGGTGSHHAAVVVAITELGLRRVQGVDPWLGAVEVTGAARIGAQVDVASPDWARAVALGQLAIGHELVGAARRMLELAREHALERIQFGRPIAMFQAVRHRLADTLVAVETADAVLAAAWEDQSPQTAAIAKALAGRGARTAARHCQQVLAGIGFTTEHSLHRYIRRVLVLDQLFGSARSLTTEFGKDLVDSRRLPALLPL